MPCERQSFVKTVWPWVIPFVPCPLKQTLPKSVFCIFASGTAASGRQFCLLALSDLYLQQTFKQSSTPLTNSRGHNQVQVTPAASHQESNGALSPESRTVLNV